RSREFGHNLERLWQRYKELVSSPALDRFDSMIKALHEFEELRYPDNIPLGAVTMSIAWTPEHAAKPYSGTTPARQYEVFISDVDGLIIEILDRAEANPEFYVTETVIGDGSRAKVALMYQNQYAARWGLDPREISGLD